jgi:hypothetical protein
MLISGFPFFLSKVKMTMKFQGEKAKTQEETLIQSGECKLCFYGHKNLSACSGCRRKTIPPIVE